MGQEEEYVKRSSECYNQGLSSNQNHSLLIKVGSDLTLEGGKQSESERLRFLFSLFVLSVQNSTSRFCYCRKLERCSTSKVKTPGFQAKHMQKSKITHIVFNTNK